MFRFGLESVLKHRSRIEEFARKDFAEAQEAVNQQLSLIEAMYKRVDEVRVEILEAQREGSKVSVQKIKELEEFLVGQKVRIESARFRLRELMMVAEQKQEVLIEAAKDKKVLQKLKERRKKEYLEHIRLLEMKELEDMTTVRQVWRKK